jgi:hypothetical protein
MSWLLLVYKVPREPTSSRVYVWRKLKQLGAISVQDAIWVLPARPRTQEQFQWLAAEIIELGGEVSLFQSDLVFGSEGSSLQEQFETPVRAAYEEILTGLEGRKPNLAGLSKKFQQTQERDYFPSALSERVRKKLLEAGGGKA